MSDLTRSSVWQVLKAHHRDMANVHMRTLFAEGPDRFARFSLSCGDVLLDYSKNRITGRSLSLLLDLARFRRVEEWRDRMFEGDKINTTEGRAALHVALRDPARRKILVDGKDVLSAVKGGLAKMAAFAEAVRSGTRTGYRGKPFTDIVHLGIGGSVLGPAMVTEALRPYAKPGLAVHFVSNVDGWQLTDTLRRLNPETTLFLIVSKTFATQETLANARAAREWFVAAARDDAVDRHFVAVTANTDAATAFGVVPDNIFEFWDWVGGRYSLWSAVGLPIALSVGMERFEALLAGAHEMDEHFRSAPLESNMPVVLAMLGIWYINFFGAETHAVLPYGSRLQGLPAYLQQADMESNGKSADRDGNRVDYATGPVVWGGVGTDGQHAFHQLLHQTTRVVPTDFVVAADAPEAPDRQHDMLLANALGQAESLMAGSGMLEADGSGGSVAPHKVCPGNQPSNVIVVRTLDARTLGALIALYEHKIFVQGIVWNINSFDQWGVEMGKALAKTILPQVFGAPPPSVQDSSTTGLIDFCRRTKRKASRR